MGPKKLDPPRLSCWEEKAAGREKDASGHLPGETTVEMMTGQGWVRAACACILPLYLNLNLMSGPLDGLGELSPSLFAPLPDAATLFQLVL